MSAGRGVQPSLEAIPANRLDQPLRCRLHRLTDMTDQRIGQLNRLQADRDVALSPHHLTKTRGVQISTFCPRNAATPARRYPADLAVLFENRSWLPSRLTSVILHPRMRGTVSSIGSSARQRQSSPDEFPAHRWYAALDSGRKAEFAWRAKPVTLVAQAPVRPDP